MMQHSTTEVQEQLEKSLRLASAIVDTNEVWALRSYFKKPLQHGGEHRFACVFCSAFVDYSGCFCNLYNEEEWRDFQHREHCEVLQCRELLNAFPDFDPETGHFKDFSIVSGI